MPPLFNHPRLKELRRRLRRKQTYAERVLWSQLRGRRLGGYKFHRQYSVGRYVVDFYCAEHRLAIELDGPEHLTDEGRAHDAQRTAYLNRLGIRVLRFTNEEFLSNPNEVVPIILAALEKE